jgi:hypothetical protein
MRKYVIVNSSEVSNLDFSQLVDSSETSRYSLDGSKILVRFEGDTPSFLIGEPQYDNEEILSILAGAEWTDPDAQP